MTAYASADDLVEHLSLPAAEASLQDALLTRAVESATRFVNKRTGRRFDVRAVTARTYRPTDPYCLKVDDISTLTGLVVKTDTGNTGTFATTLTIGTDFVVRPENALADLDPVTELVTVNGIWPMVCGPRNRVQVTAAWGWPEVPEDIVEATLLRAAGLYKRKNTPDGIAGVNDFGPLRVGRTDADVESLIGPYCNGGALVA